MAIALDQQEIRRFRDWLERTSSLSRRAICDNVSRLKRVALIINVLEPASENELVYRLREKNTFTNCTMTVRSQLKRAAVLYRQFKANKIQKGSK